MKILSTRGASPEKILQAFDALLAADLDFINGRWRGFEILTGHGLDGLQRGRRSVI
ncbi:GXWXG domain-containing protein [Agrobacterium rosae]|uniref:GXWXG domain-containing protein n=1 Tax=Agrobacterium rosae TaxID=1972867 RepID=UPI003B9F57D1